MTTDLVTLERKIDGLISEVGRQGALHENRFEKVENELSRQGALHENRFEKVENELSRQGALHENRFEKVENELSRQGVLGEERDGKLDLMLDVVLRINERLADKDDIGSMIKNHEFRIRALEIKAAQKA